MPDDALDDLLQSALNQRRSRHLLRSNQIVTPIDAVHVEIDARRYVNFSSNNYLGLTHHPALAEAARRAAEAAGIGAAASPLISGYTHIHQSAEHALARWKGTQSAVLLPSGYQANHAAVQALAGAAEAAGRPIRVLLDKLVHASLIDAVRGSGLSMRVFGHSDLAKLARLLEGRLEDQIDVVVTESVFSMDGDAAPLAEIVQLKHKHGFTLLLDEAHGSGVYGAAGSGYASECGLCDDVDLFVVTLSKSLGGAGGAICGSKALCDAVINFGRAYIYSTSISPLLAAAGEAAIEVMRNEPQRQQRVRMLAQRVRGELMGIGVAIPPGDSPIIPVMLRSEEAALHAAEKLRSAGMLLVAVRPPTVPAGGSRLRITLSCEHSDEEVDALLAELAGLELAK